MFIIEAKYLQNQVGEKHENELLLKNMNVKLNEISNFRE